MQTLADLIRTTARQALGIPASMVPYSAQRPILRLALNRAFREPLQAGELDFLDGHRIRIRILDAHVDWVIEMNGEAFMVVDRGSEEDVSISGNLLDFTLLATRRVDHDTLFFQRRIRIEGDTELGLGLKNTMDSMDWDDLPPPLRMFLQGLGLVIERLSFLKPRAEAPTVGADLP